MLDNDLPSTSNGVGTQMNNSSAYPLAKLLKDVEKAYDNGKKLLEESKKRSDDAVLTSRKDGDARYFRTENGVAIELNRQIQNGGEILEVNDIRSVHGRNMADIVYPIVQNGTLKWVDKEKGLAYLSFASRYVQQVIDKQDLNTATKV